MNEKLRETIPCPVCGGIEFEWWKLADAYMQNVSLAKKGAIPLTRIFNSNNRKVLNARNCIRCGNTLLFSEQ